MTSDASSRPALDRADIRSILIGVMLAMFLSALDQTIIATALPTIGGELRDNHHLPWIVTIYLLTSTAVTPLYGKLADIKGRRVTLLIALGLFILGSVASAAAEPIAGLLIKMGMVSGELSVGMLVLIIARGIQGVGGGGLISVAQTIIGDMIPPSERARYQAYFAIVFASSSLLGPVLGGFLASKLHWSVIFWINVPLGAVAFFIVNNRLKKLPRHDRPHSLDVIGAVLMMAATILLLLALNWGGTRYAWTATPILTIFAASFVCWVLFALRLIKADEPLIPPEILKNQVVRTGVLAAGFGVGTYIGMSIYLPIYFQAARGLSASESGLAMIPMMFGSVCCAQITGRFLPRITHYKRLSLGGLTIAVIGSSALAFLADHMSFTMVEITLALLSAGLGSLFPTSMVTVQNAVPLHQLGTATAAANFFRSLGGALVVALFGAIVIGSAHASGALDNLASIAPDDLVALVRAYTYVFATAAIGFALSLLILFQMKEIPLRGRVEVAASQGE